MIRGSGLLLAKNPVIRWTGFFDTKYLTTFIKNHKDASVKKFNQALMERIKQFKGENAYPDDISVLTCRIF